MKFAYLAILPFLAGCSHSWADPSYYNYPIDKYFSDDLDEELVAPDRSPRAHRLEIIDTTSQATIAWLSHNYDPQHILITGNRTEDCDRNDIIGHGVIITINKDTPVQVKSGVVCIDHIGIRRLQLD